MKSRSIQVLELEDFKGTIKEFKAKIEKLAEMYGEDSTIYLDAGYNNVDVVVVTKKETSK
jgi:hypothetical protein